ncbi:MAG: conjugative transposon protein TraK [Chitinophagaceae bacterium]|jgi:conjugative transposon TraK protein|nr:conjugative transposon protein TraK [Chitinophagaceae bacterium]MCA6439311.1 conjugative transposon protein TraK [Chitinophagaceae bacterium]MCA6448107.1 conjugative transposon protein TraK [Chitinophagaceae bacterium]
MFKATQDINRAFQAMRVVMLVALIGCLLICLVAIYQYGKLMALAEDRMYILVGDRAVQVFASSRKENIGVEARDHIKTFHELFFSLDPDEKAIQFNITKALYLADATAKRQYDDLREKGFYEGVVSGNISQEVWTDSVVVDIRSIPYVFVYYGKLKLIRPTSVLTRNLITKGRLRNVSRSDHNPHGFLMERWEIIDNKDLQVETR